MSWIDIFLSDGDPHRVYGADAKEALTHMLRLRELPLLWASYRRAGLRPRDQAVFLVLDVVRSVAPGPERNQASRFERLWNGPNAKLFRGIVTSDEPHPYCRECYFLYP